MSALRTERRPAGRARAPGRWAPVLLVALPLLAACDLFGPSGPGAVTATVEADSVRVGAAVLQVRGTGIRGFSARGGARIFDRVSDSGEGGEETYRLVVVSPDEPGLVFEIEVDDVAAPFPSTLVFSAADASDRTIDATANVRVRMER